MARQPQEHIAVPKITIETVDQCVHDWLDQTLDAHVNTPNGKRLKVQVLFSSGERWVDSRSKRGVRDKNGVLILPLISVRRASIDSRVGMSALGVETPNIQVSRQISPKTNQLQNANVLRDPSLRSKDPVVYEVTTIPYPDVSVMKYDVQIQAQQIIQMNAILEKLFHELDMQKSFVMPIDRTRKHPPIGEQFEDRKPFAGGYLVGLLDENLGSQDNFEEFTDQERIVRYQFSFNVPVCLLLDPEGEKPSIKVERTAFKVDIQSEAVNTVEDPYDLELIFNSRDPISAWREMQRRNGLGSSGPFGSPSVSTAVATTSPTEYLVDFTSPSLPSGVTVSRPGGTTIYAATSARTAQATTGAVYENRGDTGGWWSFASYSNQITQPFDHTTWTAVGSPTVSHNVAQAPDGTMTADLLSDTGTTAHQYIYTGDQLTVANRVHSTWVRDASPVPGSPGGLWTGVSNPSRGISNGSGGNWRRIAWYSETAEQHALVPAGYDPFAGTFNDSVVGSVNVWGDQEINGVHDLPLVAGSTAAQTIQITDLSLINSTGDLDMEVSFVARTMGNGTYVPSTSYVFSGQTAAGLISLRFDGSTWLWTATINGSDVFNTVNCGGWPNGKEIKARFWYRNSNSKAGIRITTNGCVLAETAAVVTTALSPFTSLWIGSNLGASGFLHGQVTKVHAYPSSSTDNGALPAEIVLIGDSIVAWQGNQAQSGGGIYTISEARTRPGIYSLAYPGNTIANQKAAYLASSYSGNSSVRAFLLQVGINDVIAGSSAATIEAALQDLVNTIRTNNPLAKILVCKMIPTSLTAANMIVWQAVNAYIAGDNLTNVDYVVTAASDALNDGSNHIKTQYDSGDGVHPNNVGRDLMASCWRSGGFVPLGILP